MNGFDPKALCPVLERAVGLQRPLALRSMFGGVGAYADGAIFAILTDAGLALKLGADERQALLQAGGAPLRVPPEHIPSKSYVLVPATLLEDPAGLGDWAEKSIAFAKALPPKPPRPARGR
jgi:TfoX/Sxy family transcriptional regulator of competence genes